MVRNLMSWCFNQFYKVISKGNTIAILRFVVLLFGIVSGINLYAQDEPQMRRGSTILDDSTKQIYGPTTSRYFFEDDVFFNKQKFYFIDTIIHDFHRFNYVQRYNNLYQDLGNVGTAIKPIYFEAPEQIGVTSGFHAYDLYWDHERIQYYDTKSPYTNMKVILGGKGRSMTDVGFSRNVNPQWNAGFNFRTILMDKQIQRTGRGDRHVIGTYYDFYTSYFTKDEKYRLFFNFRRNRHQVDEYGGVLVNDAYELSEFYDTNAQPNLTEAESRELRMNLHFFHQYEIANKALQIYHTFDRGRQENQFFDTPDEAPEDFYDHIEVDSAQTRDYAKLVTLRNEFGIKGNLLKLFYNGYYAIRQYDMHYKYMDTDSLFVPVKGFENYLGGRLSLDIDSIFTLTGWAELMDNGNYRIEGTLSSRWLEASLKQRQYMPSFLQQAYRGSHDAWNNNFGVVESSQLSGTLHYRSKFVSISPGIALTRLNNYVYFKYGEFGQEQKVLPVQSEGNQVFTSPELRFGVRAGNHIGLTTRTIYTLYLQNDDNAILVPPLFVNAQIAYDNIFFHGNLDLHTGFEIHWKSAYTADAYDLVTQQYYRQNDFTVPDFPIIDVFVNAKIRRSRVFFKYNNLLQLFTKEGYLATPYYPGQRNVFDFGFDWSFYD